MAIWRSALPARLSSRAAGHACGTGTCRCACACEQLGADKPFTGVAHAQIEGAYVGAVQTQSGLYSVVDRGASLSAMRVAEAPGLQIGAQVALTKGANGVAAGIEEGVGLEWKG